MMALAAGAAVVCDECRKHANIPTLANKACDDQYSPAHDQSIEKAHASAAASCIKVQRDDAGRHFDCNICLDGCYDPVVTHCGHLFCWPCLYSWLSLHSGSKECPICRANVQDKIVPLYGGGGGRAQQSTNSAATMFPGMHNIPSRPLPSTSRSHVPDVAANAVTHLHDDDEPRDRVAIQDYEIHTSTSARHAAASAGFLASMLRCGMTSLAAYSGRGFLCDDDQRAASIVAPRQRQRQRQRFSNEKEFVLHWAFIFVASIAIVCFIVS